MAKIAVADKPKRVAKFHIYMVEINGEVKLIRTTSRAKALKHVRTPIVATIPTVDQLVELVKQGVNVEEVEA